MIRTGSACGKTLITLPRERCNSTTINQSITLSSRVSIACQPSGMVTSNDLEPRNFADDTNFRLPDPHSQERDHKAETNFTDDMQSVVLDPQKALGFPLPRAFCWRRVRGKGADRLRPDAGLSLSAMPSSSCHFRNDLALHEDDPLALVHNGDL
jgi:hypothetical protein